MFSIDGSTLSALSQYFYTDRLSNNFSLGIQISKLFLRPYSFFPHHAHPPNQRGTLH